MYTSNLSWLQLCSPECVLTSPTSNCTTSPLVLEYWDLNTFALRVPLLPFLTLRVSSWSSKSSDLSKHVGQSMVYVCLLKACRWLSIHLQWNSPTMWASEVLLWLDSFYQQACRIISLVLVEPSLWPLWCIYSSPPPSVWTFSL